MYNILIVEDEKILRDAYATILTQEGFTVWTAPDGSAALEQLALHRPNLILLDLLMPVMDGFAFLEAAGFPHRQPGVQVLAFSNLSDHQRLQQLLQTGAMRHVLKSSLSPRELATAIRGMLDGPGKRARR